MSAVFIKTKNSWFTEITSQTDRIKAKNYFFTTLGQDSRQKKVCITLKYVYFGADNLEMGKWFSV